MLKSFAKTQERFRKIKGTLTSFIVRRQLIIIVTDLGMKSVNLMEVFLMSKKKRPKRIRLEASSVCQLKCPTCPNTNKEILPIVGKGFLQLSNFQKLLYENPWISEIELSNFGEIFLNPDLLEIIKHAYERKVALTANNGVNLNNVESAVLEGLVKYKFQSMTCSLDGVSNETYKRYRIGGNYDTVIENIKKINLFKKQHKSRYPLLTWQFVVFGYNEHEIPIAQKLADELDMNFHLKLSWDTKFSPEAAPILLGKKLELLHGKNTKKSMEFTICRESAINCGMNHR